MSEQQALAFEEPQARCGSCGGPAGEGELCPSCLEAFSSVLGKPRLVYAAPVDAPTKVADMSRPPAQPSKIRPELVAVAAVAIVAVVGIPVGARWLRNQIPMADVKASAPAQVPTVVSEKSSVVHEAASPSPVPAGAPAAASARAEVNPPSSPEPARASRVASAVPSKKKSEPSATRSEPAAPALDFTPMAVAPLAHTATVQPPAPQQPVVTAEAPAGRLYEPSDVDEAPRVATRVEPQLPVSPAGRAVNDVVVVRILVTHTGHPFQINLLRRSKLGPSVDEAVVAAVKQWTFSPARRRGEVVSCWFNVGVAVAN